MSDDDIKALLIEIRDNQRAALEQQQEHVAIAREQMERARDQIKESLRLQQLAIDRTKQVSRIAVPGIVICIVLIIFLIVTYL